MGLAGELASGKGTVAKYILEKYQGSTHRFSTMLRDILDRLYLPQSRENLQKLSTAIRQNYGEETFSRVIAGDVKKDDHEIITVDGVRRFADIKYLKEYPEFKLVYIETELEKRFDRIRQRGENPDDKTKTLEQFKKDQEGEADAQIRDLKQYADFVVNNDGTPEELYRQVEKIIEELRK